MKIYWRIQKNSQNQAEKTKNKPGKLYKASNKLKYKRRTFKLENII